MYPMAMQNNPGYMRAQQGHAWDSMPPMMKLQHPQMKPAGYGQPPAMMQNDPSYMRAQQGHAWDANRGLPWMRQGVAKPPDYGKQPYGGYGFNKLYNQSVQRAQQAQTPASLQQMLGMG